MSSYEITKIGLKLIGVYFIVIALGSVSSVLVSYEVAYSNNYQHPGWVVISTITNTIIMLVIGIFLSLKTDVISSILLRSNGTKEQISKNINLSLAIKVLGLFFAAGSIGDVVEGVITVITVESSLSLYISMITPGVVTVVIGLLLIYKADVISKLMDTSKE